IRHRVVKRVLVKRLTLRVRADGAEHELVTIRLSPGDACGAGHAASPTDILDDDLLPELLAHACRDDAAKHVRWPTRCERDNHRHRPLREFLSTRRGA